MQKYLINKALALLVMLPISAALSAEQRLERWGCADSGGTGEIYFLDIYASKAIYDYRDGGTQTSYDLLTAPDANRLMAARKIKLNPIVSSEPETCTLCINGKILIFDRESRNLLLSSFSAGSDFYDTSKLTTKHYDTTTKCDLLDG